jgi:hypothetical protein
MLCSENKHMDNYHGKSGSEKENYEIYSLAARSIFSTICVGFGFLAAAFGRHINNHAIEGLGYASIGAGAYLAYVQAKKAQEWSALSQ